MRSPCNSGETNVMEQARPAGQTGSIIYPPTGLFIRLGREDGLYLEHCIKAIYLFLQKLGFFSDNRPNTCSLKSHVQS